MAKDSRNQAPAPPTSLPFPPGLEYEKDLPSCPPPCKCADGAKTADSIAFRFMHNPATGDDFVPPKYVPNAPPGKTPRCGAHALSFFTSAELARARAESLRDRVNVAERFGDHIGEMKLEPADGPQTRPRKDGHFDLYQMKVATPGFPGRVARYHALGLPSGRE